MIKNVEIVKEIGLNNNFGAIVEKYVKGAGDSFAVLVNGKWLVRGSDDALAQLENGEFGYIIDKSVDEVMKLPKETPIYAGTFYFYEPYDERDFMSLTDEFETVGSLFMYAKKILSDLNPSDFIDYEDGTLKADLTENQEAIETVAQAIFCYADWQSYESVKEEIYEDILVAPYGYRALFNKPGNK